VRAVALDVHGGPPDLDPRVAWVVGAAPDAVPHDIRGLVVAHEWLDDIPLDLVERDHAGRFRLVLVTPDGRELLGPAIDDDISWAAWGLDAARSREWLADWWPDTVDARPGDRAEIGLARDDAWRDAVARLTAGTALAVDYGHERGRRPQGRPHPSLAAYRDGGRTARPVWDGSCNLTAHVAVDSLAEALGVEVTVSLQLDALRALGVSAALPDRALASSDPAAYAVALEAASDASELLDPAGLGRFHWVRVDR
jgi:SAM-dependent MidA family methyltransferase